MSNNGSSPGLAPPAPARDNSSPSRELQAQEVDGRPCFFRYITAIARTWGILTAIGLWLCATNMIKNSSSYLYMQWYALCLAIVVTFLEAVWLITKCACCKDDGNCCCTCWRIILWLDNWKKALVYVALAVPTFTRGADVLMSVICASSLILYKHNSNLIIGLLMLALAAVYFLKTCKYSECVRSRRRDVQYVETVSPRAGLVTHEVQTSTSTYTRAGGVVTETCAGGVVTATSADTTATSPATSTAATAATATHSESAANAAPITALPSAGP